MGRTQVLPVWVTASGSVKQCEAWGLENHCNVSGRARGFTHEGLHFVAQLWPLGEVGTPCSPLSHPDVFLL